jgi:hypothetical protein
VRVICEKYRLRGEANIPSRFGGEEHLTEKYPGTIGKYRARDEIPSLNSL